MNDITKALLENITLNIFTEQIKQMIPLFTILITVGFLWTVIVWTINRLTRGGQITDLGETDLYDGYTYEYDEYFPTDEQLERDLHDQYDGIYNS